MHDDIHALGQRFKEVRLTLDLTLKQMAAELDKSYNYISDIERGKAKNPGPDIFIKLLRKYNVNLNYLFNGTGTMFLDTRDQTETGLPDEFDFEDDIHSVSQVIWLMENSMYFKNAVFGLASRLILSEEEAVKESIRRTKQKKIKEKQFNEEEIK